ncbi:hypothetical protein [Spongiivirga citrea]|uniref:Lipoprotein n=1 Tax=Spongiivirga citrea TaxID=1481457 RepID=A0A6M0CHE5_9FLAO|nr:hypothetical protein [Spongiivirga citrea]NER17281.1 hypothetical protein [Spongiivirga citrea]
MNAKYECGIYMKIVSFLLFSFFTSCATHTNIASGDIYEVVNATFNRNGKPIKGTLYKNIILDKGKSDNSFHLNWNDILYHEALTGALPILDSVPLESEKLLSQQDLNYMRKQASQKQLKQWDKNRLSSKVALSRNISKSKSVSFPLFSIDRKVAIIYTASPSGGDVRILKKVMGEWKLAYGGIAGFIACM